MIPQTPNISANQLPKPKNDLLSKQQAEEKQAAQMLESLFVHQLFKAMRQTVPEDDLFSGGMANSFYSEMFDSAIADEVSKTGGLGLAEVLLESFSSSKTAKTAKTAKISQDNISLRQALANRGVLSISRKHIADTIQKVGRYSELNGITFEDPNRPEQVNITDPDGHLRWPVEGDSYLLDDEGEIQATPNAMVLSAASGKVVHVGSDSLVIEHGKGLRTTYRNLGQVLAQQGDLVLRGQQLGEIGNNGRFHFSAQRYNLTLHPMEITGFSPK